jgi:hypothetical protein
MITNIRSAIPLLINYHKSRLLFINETLGCAYVLKKEMNEKKKQETDKEEERKKMNNREYVMLFLTY